MMERRRAHGEAEEAKETAALLDQHGYVPAAVLRAVARRNHQATTAHAKDGTRYRLEQRPTTTTIHRAENKADRRARLKAEKKARGHMRVNHFDIVAAEFQRQPPRTGAFGNGAEPESSPLYQERLHDYFAFQQRVLAGLARRFPNERWGYLRIGGDNLTDHMGFRVKVGRVCGPDGQLYKIGHDIPTANDPAWEDDGIVQNDHGGEARDYYRPFEGAVTSWPPLPGPPSPPDPLPIPSGDLVTVLAKLEAQAQQLVFLEGLVKEFADLVRDARANAKLEYIDLTKRTDVLAKLAKAPRTGSVRYLGPLTIDSAEPKPQS